MSEVPAVVLRPSAGDRPFRVERFPVHGQLGAVVDHFWAVQWALPSGRHHDQDVVTYPCAHITVEDDGLWVQGVVTEVFQRRLTGWGRVVGAALRPAGLSAFTAVPAATLVDRRRPAAEVLGDVPNLDSVIAAPDVPSAVAALASWLQARNPQLPATAALVDAAVALIVARHDLTRVDDLAAELGVTVRTLQRRFDRYLGVGPKWVLQRCRIQDALSEIEDGTVVAVDWADLAVRLGYADQSHFVNSFTALIGVPPGRYTKRPTPS